LNNVTILFLPFSPPLPVERLSGPFLPADLFSTFSFFLIVNLGRAQEQYPPSSGIDGNPLGLIPFPQFLFTNPFSPPRYLERVVVSSRCIGSAVVRICSSCDLETCSPLLRAPGRTCGIRHEAQKKDKGESSSSQEVVERHNSYFGSEFPAPPVPSTFIRIPTVCPPLYPTTAIPSWCLRSTPESLFQLTCGSGPSCWACPPSTLRYIDTHPSSRNALSLLV